MDRSREIKDTENFGKSTKVEVVRAADNDARAWLANAPVSSFLKEHQIAHVGRMWAKAPFEVIRADSSGTFALTGLSGEGKALIDGSWRRVKAGDVCLLPAFAHTGIRAVNQEIWHFAWVRYEEIREISPILSTSSPVIRGGNVNSLNHAIAGLHAEYTYGEPGPSTAHHWVELIHGFVINAASPFRGDDRLWKLWELVEAKLNHPWQLSELGKVASLSVEQLRRLCQQQLGRSPIQQVTYLRIRRAVDLLISTDNKVEIIAYEVGYENPFTFSNAFKRWTGKRPSDYRSLGDKGTSE